MQRQYKIFAFPAARSFARITLRKDDVDDFMKSDIYKRLCEMCYVERYRKKQNSFYITTEDAFRYLCENAYVTCRECDRMKLGLG